MEKWICNRCDKELSEKPPERAVFYCVNYWHVILSA